MKNNFTISLLTSAVLLSASPYLFANEDDSIVTNDSPAIDVVEEQVDEEEKSPTKLTIELKIEDNEGDENDNAQIDLKIEKDGKTLNEEETDAELEQWQQEVITTLDDVFRGNPRKGIFALQQDRDGGFLEFGFGLKSSDGLTMIDDGYEGVKFAGEVNAGIQISGLFFEYFSASPDRGLYGLNFFNSNHLGMDLILGKEHKTFADDKDDAHLLSIHVRHADLTGGIRTTAYVGPIVMQGQIRKEISQLHNGFTASAQAGTSVQIKNLNIHAVAGAAYQSAEVMDYYYGVDADESNADFAQYQAGEETTLNAEVGLSYPVSESWVLRGQINYTLYDDQRINSPFWQSDDNEHISSALSLMLVL